MLFSRTLVSSFIFSSTVNLVLPLLLTLLLTSVSLCAVIGASGQFYPAPSTRTVTSSLLPSDAVSLLTFQSKADLDHKLLFTLNERYDYCSWQGVKCAQGRVVRFVLQGFGLRGTFAPDTLTHLDQLRVLSLRNNSLYGPIPDLAPLVNLKSLFLDHNHFSGSFPLSVLSLHRLLTLHLSHNNLTGPIPVELNGLDRLISLHLESNEFSGPFPPLNLSSLQVFNVSWNNFTGAIPVTPTLGRFDASSYSWNPGLCGEIIHKACRSRSPFFGSTDANSSSPGPLGQSAQGIMVVSSSNPEKHNSKTGAIIGFTIGVLLLIALILCAFVYFGKWSNNKKQRSPEKNKTMSPPLEPQSTATAATTSIKPTEMGILANTARTEEMECINKSGKLVFCSGESQLYTLDQLMKASAELLGRGTIGITYKAVLDNQLIVTVKRLDASKTAITSSEAFERHMEAVGWLRHPYLVAVRAYFQAKGERLVIYDYQPNGSLYNLIHGSRSNRAKPLHWTSCLKIAEDVAQGLAYIHQASNLVHGNLKSSNVLLGMDFEACITDYCLAVLADSGSTENPDSTFYRAPETRKSKRNATFKSDIYSFGVLLLELLSGKHPSQHPFLAPTDVLDWVRAMRDGEGAEDNQLGMLTEVASICSVTSPEQRPAMWQVLKMIQQIKESVLIEGDTSRGFQ